jgi:hypothetical protein
MSASSGVDFVDKDLKTYLNYSRQKREESEDASALGFIFERFAEQGQYLAKAPITISGVC